MEVQIVLEKYKSAALLKLKIKFLCMWLLYEQVNSVNEGYKDAAISFLTIIAVVLYHHSEHYLKHTI